MAPQQVDSCLLLYRWDTNNDGIYGDKNGQHAVYAETSQGGTYRVGLEVTDSSSARAYATGGDRDREAPRSWGTTKSSASGYCAVYVSLR